MDTKKAIKEFKRENGGLITYSVKELLGGLHLKIDVIDEKLSANSKKITYNSAMIKVLFAIITALAIKSFLF